MSITRVEQSLIARLEPRQESGCGGRTCFVPKVGFKGSHIAPRPQQGLDIKVVQGATIEERTQATEEVTGTRMSLAQCHRSKGQLSRGSGNRALTRLPHLDGGRL